MEVIQASNNLEYLLEKLAEDIRQTGSGIFTKTNLVTQSSGMNSWLRTELARKNRVFANFRFLNQDGLFSAIYQLLFDEPLQNTIDIFRYSIYLELDQSGFKEKFPRVSDYYKDDDLRRMQLADRIADLFDQYQLYRKEMIEAWEQGKLIGEEEAEVWQQYLWKRIGLESKAMVRGRLLRMLREKKDIIQKNFPEIFVFGISIFTEFHREFLKELGDIIDVHFYVVLPSSDTRYRNELLESFGTKAEELAALFSDVPSHIVLPEKDTLLTRIQQSIHLNKQEVIFKEDTSLQINACHTPAREAECLYNYLLKLFTEDSTLAPGDILVLTNDINVYAPYIRAVFNNAPVRIPLRISGADITSEDSQVAALELLMMFTEDDLTSEKVVSMLEHKRIKRAFRIENTEFIRQVVRKANIRFGRENRKEDDTRYVSWKYGLEKILLGYAMYTEEEYINESGVGLYPYKDAEGAGSYDLLRLRAFVDRLLELLDEQQERKTLEEWKLYLFEEVLDTMVYRDDFSKDDRQELSAIYRALSFIDRLGVEEAVPYHVFLEELKKKLFTESREVHLNTGNVTVTPPLPVRGIPARVICFMGLDNGTFPRKDIFLGFDLLGLEYRKGDRSKMENDKFLFLDTLLAAREKLYLSYIGQSIKDNEPIPPSIVVDTLVDFLDQENLIIRHPLHGFSVKYNADNPKLYSYLYGGDSVSFHAVDAEIDTISEVTLRSFTKFFENSMEWYFNNVLDIYYDEKERSLPETEIFDLNGLEKWKIRNDLIQVKEEDLEDYMERCKKEGALPLKNNAKLKLDKLNEEIANLRTSFNEITSGKNERTAAIELGNGKTRISGSIDNIFDRTLVCYSVSGDSKKYEAGCYLKALLLKAKNEIDQAVFLNREGEIKEVPLLTPEDAKKRIFELIFYFEKGRDKPLLFSINTALQVLERANTSNIFDKETEGNMYAGIPPNKYMNILKDEGYFIPFEVEDYNKDEFDESIYEITLHNEISTIANLLNIRSE